MFKTTPFDGLGLLTTPQLESIYRSVTVVANICIYAAPDKHKPIAIIVPAEPALKKLAGDLGLQGEHLEELIHEPKLNSAVLKQMQDAGRKGGLASFEILDGVVLADEEWNPQNVSSSHPCFFPQSLLCGVEGPITDVIFL